MLRSILRFLLRPLLLRVINPFVVAEPNFTAVHRTYGAKDEAYRRGTHVYALPPKPAPEARLLDQGFPIPPQSRWQGYGDSEQWYLESGQQNVAEMFDLLRSNGVAVAPDGRVLDFGCAAGRMTRWLPEYSSEWEIWGTDIVADNVSWCQHNLTPRMSFLCNSTLPHLPFQDGYFDFIYSRSVFTHIAAELSDAWFLELRRLLSPGGFLYVTVLDQSSIDLLRNSPLYGGHRLTQALTHAAKELSLGTHGFSVLGLSSTVFFDRRHLLEKLASMFEVLSVAPANPDPLPVERRRLHGFQTAVLLRQRERPGKGLGRGQ